MKSFWQYLWLATAGVIIQWVLFKLLYPFPDFFSDSYSYIYAAAEKLDVSIWPIGYSKFLYAFHQVSHSDTALVSFQYFFFEAAALYFFYTLLRLYKPGKTTINVLFIFLFFDPLSLYMCNYVSSDALFAAISLLWFTGLLWIIYRPRTYQVFTQAILLFLAFSIRNNAYYYPVLSILAFGLSRQPVGKKILGSALGLVLIGAFVIHTCNVAYQLTGIRQFSLFTGWQLANNALYMYNKIDVDSTKLPTARSVALNREAKKFFSRVNSDAFDDFKSQHPGNLFMQYSISPLKQYLSKHYKYKDELGEVAAWGMASADFVPFGKYLIETHPFSFIRYFMLLNTKNYFVPPLEKLEQYNRGSDSVSWEAVQWFHYPSPRVRAVSKGFQNSFLFLLPWLFLIINLAFMGFVAWYIIAKKPAAGTFVFNRSLVLVSAFWLANAAFGIFATILVLRYEFFPMLLLGPFTLILYEQSSDINGLISQAPASHPELKNQPLAVS